ncbi:hypothetical protein RJ640_013053 [Escallonia rubra]|uniref:Uncharacterized protein n=1 Tax=Escallonia rubra TaxID=112253 RepID=A0AA88R1D1_9ASTE|nr:hypothetical protein RJ640_013053 [Escallonia rubra]
MKPPPAPHILAPQTAFLINPGVLEVSEGVELVGNEVLGRWGVGVELQDGVVGSVGGGGGGGGGGGEDGGDGGDLGDSGEVGAVVAGTEGVLAAAGEVAGAEEVLGGTGFDYERLAESNEELSKWMNRGVHHNQLCLRSGDNMLLSKDEEIEIPLSRSFASKYAKRIVNCVMMVADVAGIHKTLRASDVNPLEALNRLFHSPTLRNCNMAAIRGATVLCLSMLVMSWLMIEVACVKYIGYAALGQGVIPCGPNDKRCQSPPANVYTRGCELIERCRPHLEASQYIPQQKP